MEKILRTNKISIIDDELIVVVDKKKYSLLVEPVKSYTGTIYKVDVYLHPSNLLYERLYVNNIDIDEEEGEIVVTVDEEKNFHSKLFK